MMPSRLQKWGNSQGIRIPKDMLKHTHLKVGEEVHIFVDEGKIIIEATHAVHGKYAITDLVRDMPDQCALKEELWGDPVGREVW